MNTLSLANTILFFDLVRQKYIYYSIIGLWGISLMLVVGIFYVGIRRSIFRKKKKQLKEYIEPFITKIIVHVADNPDEILLPETVFKKTVLNNRYSRQIMIDEILLARKNFSGNSGENIRLIYERLELDKDSEKKLHSYAWHRRAKGIQELSIMQQRKHLKKIYSLTNYPNKYVRMEAQSGVIRLEGFDGLSFLNTTTYTITEWQQLNLLQLISRFKSEKFKEQEKWLQSSNTSVVIFALKLIANFRRYELHDKIILCLHHLIPEVRIQAVKTLGEIYQEDTYKHVIKGYYHDTSISFRIQALISLGKIGSEEATSFLTDQLNTEEIRIKIEAARALIKSSSNGILLLQRQGEKDNASSWPIIIEQLKYETCI